MTNADFQKLLNRCSNAAHKHKELCDLVDVECEKRYGTSYSDVDADGIIDVLNYLGGTLTVKQFDDAMVLGGCESYKSK